MDNAHYQAVECIPAGRRQERPVSRTWRWASLDFDNQAQQTENILFLSIGILVHVFNTNSTEKVRLK